MDIDQDPPSLPTMTDLRGVAADLDEIDEVLARLDAAEDEPDGPDGPDVTDETLTGQSVDLEEADDEGPWGQASDFAIR